MKVYVVFDTEGCVHGVYRQKEDALAYLFRQHEQMVTSPNFCGVGISKYHVWWESDGEEHNLIMREAELR